VSLEVRTDSPAAVNLYRRFGFKTVDTVKGFYKDGCDAYVMKLLLKAQPGTEIEN